MSKKLNNAVQNLLVVVQKKLAEQNGGVSFSENTAYHFAKDMGYLSVKQRAGTLLTEKGENLLVAAGETTHLMGAAVVEERFNTNTETNA